MPRIEPDRIAQLPDTASPFQHPPVEAEPDVPGYAQMREQGAFLRHEADAAPVRWY